MTRFATQYNVLQPVHAERWGAQFAYTQNQETLTQQSDRKNCDINLIVARFTKTGQLPKVQQEPLYADFSTVTDYRSALDMINHANEAFQEVPAQVREKFNNDPAEFLTFLERATEHDLEEIGLGNAPKLKDTPNTAPTRPQEPDNATERQTTNTTRRGDDPHRPSEPSSQGLPEGSSNTGVRTKPAEGSSAR